MHDPRRNEPTDEHLGESLRRLPEARAGEGFTRAVLARVEASEAAAEAASPRRPGTGGGSAWLPLPTPRLAAVLATAVVVGLVGAPLLLNGPAGPAPEATPAASTEADGDGPADGTGGHDAPNRVAAAGGERAGADRQAPAPPADFPQPRTGTEGREDGDARTGERLAAVDLPPPAGPPPANGPQDGAQDGAASGDRPEAGSERPPGGAVGSEPADAPGTSTGADRDRTRSAPPAVAPRGDVRLAAGSTAEELDRQAVLRRLADLRQRQERLRADLAALGATGQPGRAPALLLGGDENVELVLDLGSSRRADTGGSVRPAGHRPGSF